MYFVIKTFKNVQQALWHFLYSFDFMLSMNPVLIFVICSDSTNIKLLRSRIDTSAKLSYSGAKPRHPDCLSGSRHQSQELDTSWVKDRLSARRSSRCSGYANSTIRTLGYISNESILFIWNCKAGCSNARWRWKIGNYYLSPESVNSSESLRRQIFPRVEESLEYICSRSDDEQDLAAQVFLKFFDRFRTILLQDSSGDSTQIPSMIAHSI